MPYKIAFLDADETLFDFKAAEKSAIEQAMKSFSAPCPNETYALYHDINDALWKKLERGEITQDALRRQRFAELFSAVRLDIDIDAFAPVFLRELSQGSKLLPGATELLQALKGKIRLCLATNGISEVQRGRLKRSGLEPFFDHIFISLELGAQKPEKAFFDSAFEALGSPDPSGCIILGDSLSSDMRGGRNAGIATCWFNPSKNANPAPEICDYEISELSQFIDIALR